MTVKHEDILKTLVVIKENPNDFEPERVPIIVLLLAHLGREQAVAYEPSLAPLIDVCLDSMIKPIDEPVYPNPPDDEWN